MTGYRIPDQLGHEDRRVDRLLVAGWLAAVDEGDAALRIASSVLGSRGHAADLLHRVRVAVDSWLECHDVPEQYAWRAFGLTRPGRGRSWEDWSDAQCEDIFDEIVETVRVALERFGVVLPA